MSDEQLKAENARLLDEVERLNRRIAQLEANRPKCMGTWLKGSGGHRQYAHDCPNPGRWDVMGGGYVCDEHKSTKGADDDAWTIDDELRMLRDAISEDKESLVERSLMYKAERDAARAEIADLRLRPPMSCTACENHNQELADKNRALQDENDELREAISDEAVATLADRNEIRRHMHAVMDALVFATDPIDMNIDYATAGARTEALVEEVRRLREIVAGYNRHDAYLVQRRKVGELRDRLAILEPVWEAAKRWRQCDESTSTGPCSHDDLADAIDAAVAKEGK